MSSLILLNIFLLITCLAPVMVETNLGEDFLLKIQFSIVLLSIGLYAWHSWRTRILTSPEPKVHRTYGRLIGEPRFDPLAGIIATVLVDGKASEIILQPKWWNFLGQTNINKSTQETTTDSSPISSVPVGKEPGSLVCLQLENGKVIGMASRVKIGSRSVLLTNFHVVKRHPCVYICKNGERVKLEPDWEAEAWCADVDVDFIAIRVPEKVWSVLGVSSAQVRNLRGCVPITCYGASSSDAFLASSGMATYVKGLTIRHDSSTVAGWSGSPLYYKGAIIGLHRGFHVVGESNNATIMETLLSTAESPMEDGGIREIDVVEAEFRSDFVDYEIGGRGTISVGESEFVRKKSAWVPNGPRWADLAEEEDAEYFDSMETVFDEVPLNGLQAVSECSPPYTGLEGTVGQIPCESLVPECPSLLLGDRVCVLEKLVEQLTLSTSRLLEIASQNSEILAGLNAERTRNSIHSYSKPLDLEKQPSPPPLTSVVIGSVPVTLGPNPVLNLGETPGTKKKLRRRRKRSVSKASTSSLPQGSLSQK